MAEPLKKAAEVQTEEICSYAEEDVAPDSSTKPSLTRQDTAQSSSSQQSKLTFLDAFALLVSLQIGSGIFASPSQVNRNAAAPGYALLIWLASGSIAWIGAICFAELGGALPLNGGTQEYLKYIFGDGLAFIYAWIAILALKPCSVTVQAITFAQYWVNAVFGVDGGDNVWYSKALAVASLYIIVAFNMVSLNTTARMMKVFTVIKLATILLLFVLTGCFLVFHLHLGKGQPNTDWFRRSWFGVTNQHYQPGVLSGLGQTMIALFAGLWACSGWDSANVVAGDISNPGRNLPLALNTAQPLIISSFMLANVCYYIVVPWVQIDTTNTIAVFVGDAVLGWPGSVAFAVLVSLACLGSMNVNVLSTSRQVVSAAQSNWLPISLAKYSVLLPSRTDKRPESAPLLIAPDADHTKGPPKTPIRAMLLSAIITTVYIYFGSFETLVTFMGLTEYTFATLTISGLLVLRFREPELPRPFKTYTIVPIIFLTISISMLVVGCIQAPVQAMLLLVLIVAGLLRKYTTDFVVRKMSYTTEFVFRRVSRSREAPQNSDHARPH